MFENIHWFDILCWYLGIAWALHMRKKRLENEQSVARLHQENPQETHSKIFTVYAEKHGDIIYLFEEDTNEFLAQGRDAREIGNHINQRFPHIKIFKLNIRNEENHEYINNL